MVDRQRILTILPFVIWSSVLLLLWCKSSTEGLLSWFLFFLLPIYLVTSSLAIVKHVEKQSVVQRFGVQPARLLFLSLLALTSLAATFIMTNSDWASFSGVVFAPIPEEVFFRGYMLGRWINGGTSKSLKLKVGFLLLSSVIFSLSHFFAGYALTDYPWSFVFGFGMGFVYWLTGSILLIGALHTAFNLSLDVKKEYFSARPLWIAIIILPSFLLFGVEWLRRKKKELERQLQLFDTL